MEPDARVNLESSFRRWRAASALDAETLDELEAHLRDAVADGLARGLPPAEAFRDAVAQLGEPAQLAGEFSKLRKHQNSSTMIHTLLHSPRLRRLARQFALAIAIALPLRVFALVPYRVVGASVAPEIPAGSHLIVWQLAPQFAPGDIAAYRDGTHTFLGRVSVVSDTGLTITRADQPTQTIAREAVIGRVILSTR